MRHLAPLMALALALPACAPEDADGDGVPASLDCNDADFNVYPGATEICDGVDNDCNDVVDDDYARGGQIFFLDRDGDGYGVWELAQVRCAAPAGFVDNADDCSDDDADVYPDAPEFCDKIDQNCDGVLDDNAVDAVAYFNDYDMDGYGGSDSAVYSCEQPEGSITVGGDCDDFNVIINPEATERCNQIDDNCNGIVDDADSLDATTWYGDKDRDGFGDPEDTIQSCSQPEYYLPEVATGDCNDADPSINPGQQEVCNDGIDNNCNDSADSCLYDNWEFGADTMVTVTGSGSSAYYGQELAMLGDVNGDGFGDFIVSGYRGTGGACSNAGRIYCGDTFLVYGSEDIAGAEFTRAEVISFSTTGTYDYAGTAAAGLGDLDGDGYMDFGIGAYAEDYGGSSAGSVYVVYGAADMGSPGDAKDLNSYGQLYESSSSSYLGYAMAGGDLDGDGYSDAVFGAYRGNYGGASFAGNVYIRYGGKDRVTFGPVRELGTYAGVQSFEYLSSNTGHGMGTGDIDGDGMDDLLMGSYSYDSSGRFSSGRVYLVYGSEERLAGVNNVEDASSATFAGTESYVYLGQTATGVGDTNGDGYEDFGMCGYGYSSYAGRCAVLYGSAERWEGTNLDPMSRDVAAFTAVGTGSSSYLGYYGIGSGDFDNDGFSEVAMGAYRASDPNGSTLYTGGVMIIAGGEEHDPNYTFATNGKGVFHTTQYAYLGRGVSAESGDVNGDGYDDLLAGAYGASSFAGQGYIWLGGGL